MTQKQKNELLKIQQEVELYYSDLEITFKTKLGCKIFYSNLSEKTDILFIGINPGTGDDNTYKDVEVMDELQYFKKEWSNNSLARDTKYVFEKAGYLDKLKELNTQNRIVKTNLYYLLTRNTAELDKYLYGGENDFIEKHVDWTARIIDICKPRLIIYEGKKLNDDCPPSDNDTLKKEENGSYIKYDFTNGIRGLLYYRSLIGMKDKDQFADVLKSELDKLYT